MRITRDECQGCPYKIRHAPFVVICHPCIRAVMDERNERQVGDMHSKAGRINRKDEKING